MLDFCMGQGAWSMVYYIAGVGTCACKLRRHAPCPLPHAKKLCTVLCISENIHTNSKGDPHGI